MRLIEYFTNATPDEITERLKYLDKSIYDLHTIKDEKAPMGRFVVGDLAEIEVIDGDITMDSFHDKFDYNGSGYDETAKAKNIVQLCCIGICAYCRLQKLYTEDQFIDSLMNNIDMYLERASATMPKEMQQYYIDVFCEKKVDYLNRYLARRIEEAKENSESRTDSRGAYVYKSNIRLDVDQDKDPLEGLIMPFVGETGVKRSLASYEKAYASVLLLPALLALIYITAIVVYFVFIK